MTNSKKLAKLVGPSLLAITLPEIFNPQIWATQLPTVVYLNGGLLFVAGLSIVLAHNFWIRGWQIVLTLVGWMGILVGLARMFFPEIAYTSDMTGLIVSVAITSVVGLFLTYKAYAD